MQPCADTVAAIRADCGSITVSENRAARAGRQIDIHFVVARADRRATTAVFVFGGGPGEGSTSMASMADSWLRPLRQTMDLVFVDQRGTGQSHPLACGEVASTNPAAAFGHVFDPAVFTQCRATLERDADLTQYTTDLAVADVDDVRASLGYETVSLYGGSYGTRMAQAYLRRYPTHSRSAVIDGVVPFDVAVPLTYAASAQQSLDRVFAACAATASCRLAHPSLAADFETLLHRFDGGPVPAIVNAEGRAAVAVKMSRGDFAYAVRGLLYFPDAVTRLPAMIGRAMASRSVDEFAQAYLSREEGMEGALAYGLHLSVFCGEDVPFATEVDVDAATAHTFLGRYLFDDYCAACAVWPRAPIAADARTPVTSRVPTLLVSGFFDPVTPPEFADRVARSLPLARAVTAPLGSHGSVGGCPRAAALYVLEKGTLDGVPAVCGK